MIYKINKKLNMNEVKELIISEVKESENAGDIMQIRRNVFSYTIGEHIEITLHFLKMDFPDIWLVILESIGSDNNPYDIEVTTELMHEIEIKDKLGYELRGDDFQLTLDADDPHIMDAVSAYVSAKFKDKSCILDPIETGELTSMLTSLKVTQENLGLREKYKI